MGAWPSPMCDEPLGGAGSAVTLLLLLLLVVLRLADKVELPRGCRVDGELANAVRWLS